MVRGEDIWEVNVELYFFFFRRFESSLLVTDMCAWSMSKPRSASSSSITSSLPLDTVPRSSDSMFESGLVVLAGKIKLLARNSVLFARNTNEEIVDGHE